MLILHGTVIIQVKIMLCSDTGCQPSIKIAMPVDLARDISYLIESIKSLGGNGKIVLDVSGGNVTGTEVTVKRQRKKSA